MLEELKQYLRLDVEDTGEDSFLGLLIDTARNYILTATGKVVDETNPKHKLAVMLFCSHQYENRNPVVTTNTKTLEYSLQSLMAQIEWGD
ncbi:phage gp6-like head-tail connector protein [Paenibacillus sp. 7124]|uniref:Phage gp6-like head-tail connector protein n=1 Tax=Paenibacillus apii TaxID=1850370 RepID=A0A6M1PFL7_9BACL|nr:head-tail connector protein [Paenibacillus apii]NGM81292.1 phage gp6-like head-tail connector protein [Paenibacillus apii]